MTNSLTSKSVWLNKKSSNKHVMDYGFIWCRLIDSVNSSVTDKSGYQTTRTELLARPNIAGGGGTEQGVKLSTPRKQNGFFLNIV